jgi:RNA polymerase sigma-70 factor (ECF subfamily)
MAMLVVLETLSPLERTAFVLHDVFGYPHAEVAQVLGRSPASVRQLASRARAHVEARRPRYQPDPATTRAVTERFVEALLGGGVGALLRLLAPEVTLWTDGGGKAGPRNALPRPVHGGDDVARVLAAGSGRIPAGVEVRYRLVNGDPSAVVLVAGAPFGVVVLDLVPGGEAVREIYFVSNPDKLAHVG